MTPTSFWNSTLRELFLMGMAHDNRELRAWERTRNIEFAMYNTQYGAMSGKKIFKSIKSPKDLYTLASDKNNKPVPIDKKRQLIAVNRFKDWLKTK